jgi:hypothetical protein
MEPNSGDLLASGCCIDAGRDVAGLVAGEDSERGRAGATIPVANFVRGKRVQ